MGDLKEKLRQKTEELKETRAHLRGLLDAAETFAAEFGADKHVRPGDRLTAAAGIFVDAFTNIKSVCRGYKMS